MAAYICGFAFISIAFKTAVFFTTFAIHSYELEITGTNGIALQLLGYCSSLMLPSNFTHYQSVGGGV